MSTTTGLADAYWAETYFGMSLDEFWRPALQVVPHAGELAGYSGVFALRRHASCIVSSPPSVFKRMQDELRLASAEELFDSEFLVRLLPQTNKVIGPAWIGYLGDERSVVAKSSSHFLTGARLLERLLELQRECDAVDWEYSGLGNSNPFMAGYEVNGRIVAAAGYERWGGHLAHIGVLTHPAHRGKGHGRLVVREAARHALSQRLVPQYRTLIANVAAMRIGESLQFIKYGESIAVRL